MLQAKQVLKERYQLQQQLGRTAPGRQTWLATDLQTNEQVIVKLLAFSPQMQWEEMKLFEREAKVLANLNHPQIPRYRDDFSLEQKAGEGLLWFVLVQDYIPGITLQELLAEGKRFTETQVKEIATQVLNILIYLHEINPPVLHRDIKPSNIIWGEDEQIYLVDFGSVQDKEAFTAVTFTVVGTSGYAPLEQFWGRAVPASDLYALGTTLIHLITGIAPVDLPQKDSRIQFANQVTVSSSLISWIEKLIEPAIEKRFNTARQALELLNSGLLIKSSNVNIRNKITQPVDTRIKVNKSSERLEIYLPAGGSRKLGRFGSLGIFASLYFAKWLISLPLLVIWFLPLGLLFSAGISVALLIFFCERRNIYFEGDRFYLERQLFRSIYGKQVGDIEEILGVFLQKQGLVYQVSIRAGGQVYNLGGALSEAESIWLAQEIQDWIN
ncbi:MAG TPA: serine/threonine-protein kinase [Oculatellaceae cyanobacterium]|jgi:serine/threonine protein kinase